MVIEMKNQKRTKAVKIGKIVKIAAGLCAIAMCVHISTFSSLAYTQTTGTVIPATAKIRSDASTTSDAVGSTSAGKTVTIVDETTGSDGSTWYKVQVDGSTTGYIRSDLVTKAASSGESAASDTTETASVTTTDSQAATVSTTSANVRKSASTTADVVSSVAKGTAVTITGKASGNDGKDWYQISYTANGGTATGFIRSDLVSIGAATTEVSGTKTSDTASTDNAATDTQDEELTEEGSTEETTETTTEGTTEESSGADASANQSATGTVTVINTEETPALPTGFQEVAVTLNGDSVRAWKNGDFYIFYAQAADGTEGYYMYDSVAADYQRYFMTNIETTEDTTTKDAAGILKPVVIVLAVVLVILLIIVTVLTIKLNEYKEELGWDDEDYYPEDDIEDEEEEEEEPVLRVPKKKKPVESAAQAPRKTAGQSTARPAAVRTTTARPAMDYAERPSATKKTVSTSKPRNFMETEEEIRPVKKKVVKRPAPAPSADDFDPDDEDTFVFINLDGDDLD